MGRRSSNLRVYLESIGISGWFVREHRSSADLDIYDLKQVMNRTGNNLYIPFHKYKKVIKLKDYGKQNH